MPVSRAVVSSVVMLARAPSVRAAFFVHLNEEDNCVCVGGWGLLNSGQASSVCVRACVRACDVSCRILTLH